MRDWRGLLKYLQAERFGWVVENFRFKDISLYAIVVRFWSKCACVTLIIQILPYIPI